MADTLKSLLPYGPISTWPDDADYIEGEWHIGIAIDPRTDEPVKLRRGRKPSVYEHIATVSGESLAKALAKHLASIA